ncbi:hypothetical protein IFM89_014873 [Coptis chinensis]|uniref:Uncharacterized protein n=1 Tax=Coptis chinensis TaxID=261450 RepID=A0A835ICK5_9MAGN|nr:hypothetical protein IFM89_014873 [Coptis chinensis]
MNLRVKKKNKEREIIITTKMPKNRRQKKPTNHKNTPETSDQPAELNALDVLLERFFSPEKNSVVEEEELNNMRKRKVIVNDGKMVKKGKRTKRFNNNNNKVQERDGNVDLALGTGRIEDEDGIIAQNAGDNNSELNYEECARTQNTKDVASSSTNPRTSVDELDRCVLWKKARQNKEGVYVDDAVREKAEHIIVQDLQAQFDGILPEVPPTTPSSEKISSNANNTESRKHLTTPSVEYGSIKSQGSSGYLNDDQPLHLVLKTDWQLKNKGNTEPGMTPPESDSRIGKEEENQDDGDKSGPIQAFASLIDQIMSTDNIVIPVQSVIFEGEEVECAHLGKPDLVHLCNMQDLTAGCIITYISFLYDKSPNYQERYGFVNPAAISSARGSDASFIITKRLQAARKDQLMFIPYKTRVLPILYGRGWRRQNNGKYSKGTQILAINHPDDSYVSSTWINECCLELQKKKKDVSKTKAYDHQIGYEMPFFKPSMDESMHGQGVPSP